MNILELKIIESPETNDHQTQVFIDREDVLKQSYLGLDPVRFFKQSELLNGGKVLVGRCTCGVEGCDDFTADVEISDGAVIWRCDNGDCYEFVTKQYLGEYEARKTDFSWETSGRTAERLVADIFEGRILEGGYVFTWASSRIQDERINLSFQGGIEQKLIEIRWDGENPDTAVAAAKKLIRKLGI